MKLFYKKFTVLALLIVLSGFLSTTLNAQILYNEGFNTVVPLPAGWGQLNNSTAGGTTTWFQGNAGVFPANNGPTTSYIGANYNNTGNNGTISNWLFMPTVTMKNGDIFTFYTRVPTGGGAFPDRLQVRMSTNGASTTVGVTETSVGDFSTLLLDINPTYSPTAYPEVWTQYTIIVSGLGGPTLGRLAFRYFVEDAGFFGNNSNFIGIDDAVYTTFAAPCAGTPAPGTLVSTPATVCPTNPFVVSLQTPLNVSGLSYQWQSSPDGVTWTDIPGAILNTLTTSQLVATYYRVNVTCAGNTGTSSPVQVTMNPPTSCYCAAGSPDVIFEKISRVQYNSINNPSTSTGPYENFTAVTTDVVQQSVTPITVTIAGPFAADKIFVWIDFNQDGDFGDAGELVYTSAAGNGPHTGNITIPATSLLGSTRMRVRLFDSGFDPNPSSCGNTAYGQVEDYSVNIIPCIPVAVTNPSNATIQCGGNATFSVTSTGSGPTVKWQERTSPTATWTDLANGGVYSGVTTNTLTITGAPVSMNGYQYRVVYFGFCRSTDVTTPVTLTVNPLVATVSPASASICNGAIQQLTITNITSPQPFTTTVSSGPVAIAIPDNINTGASHTLNVAGIPAGAQITGMRVTLNMTHTYCGDMLFNLRAPNTNILALDKYLTATGNQAGPYPNTGFVNTVISSAAGLPALNTAAAQPITGTFRPDALNTLPAAFVVTNPAGYISNATGFPDLYSTPNGAWTLAMADGGPADFGTLTSWSLSIDYLVGIPATGVWGPTTPNTIFTDPAATIPYVPGTPMNTVYVLPTTTTTYNVVVTTPICVSGTTNIPVTVNNPIGVVTDPSNLAICAGGNGAFTVSAASGNNIAYQWQESTDGGGTWANIANAGIFTGATTATLTLTGVPVTYNAHQYRAILTVSACSSSVTSGAATLTVNPTPVVTITAAPTTSLYPGITTTLTANSTPAGSSFQWYKDGIAVPGATGATIVVDVDGLGDYSVTVLDVNGCAGASTASLSITAAPNDIMFIYPSPNTGLFQVRYYSAPGNNQVPRFVTIYDSKGARVYTQTFNINVPYGKIEIDMTNHSRGIYRVELSDRSGNRLKTGSVLIL